MGRRTPGQNIGLEPANMQMPNFIYYELSYWLLLLLVCLESCKYVFVGLGQIKYLVKKSVSLSLHIASLVSLNMAGVTNLFMGNPQSPKFFTTVLPFVPRNRLRLPRDNSLPPQASALLFPYWTPKLQQENLCQLQVASPLRCESNHTFHRKN